MGSQPGSKHPYPSGSDGLEGQPWGQAASLTLTSPRGSTGKVLGTHRGSSPECAGVPVGDFPAHVLQNALKLKLAVEAKLRPHKGQLE